jgi:uncharacterized protein YbaR (Trm112 family)
LNFRTPTDMTPEPAPERLLRPDVRCPRCRRTPRMRICESERAAHLLDAPTKLLGTLQCHNCDEVYPVTSAAYQRAA